MPDPKDPWAVPDAPPTPAQPDPNEVIMVDRLGVQTPVRRGDIVPGTPGSNQVDPSQVSAEQGDAAQRHALDSWDEKVGTFVEGAVDAISLGIIREHGDQAELRREVNSGSALLGGITGNALTLGAGSAFKAARGASLALDALEGGDIGKTVVSTLNETTRLQRATHEASIAAALAGAGSVGHQAMDSIIDDKPFAMEAVAKETGLGALLGFGLGLMGGGLGKTGGRLSKETVEAQGGFLDPSSPEFAQATDHVASAVRWMDDSLEAHRANLKGLQAIEDQGKFNLNSDLMKARSDALKQVDAVRKGLPENVVASMKNADPALSKGIDDYVDALGQLDTAMRPAPLERFEPTPLGQYTHDLAAEDQAKALGYSSKEPGANPLDLPGQVGEMKFREGGSFEDHYFPPDEVPISNLGANDAMSRDLPDAMVDDPLNPGKKVYRPGVKDPGAAYESIYGKPWEPLSEGPALADTGPEMARGPADEFPAGAMDKTGGARPARPPAQAAAEALDAFNGPPEARPMGGGYDTMASRGADQARPLTPRDPMDALNGDYSQQQLSVLPDGHMMPSNDVRSNAEAFSAFQDKMAQDTLAIKARKAASLEKFRSEQAPSGRPSELGHDSDQGLAGLNDFLGIKDEPQATHEPVEVPESVPKRALSAEHEFIDKWYLESQKLGPKISPGDLAASRIQQSADALYTATGGRADSISALDLAEQHGMHQARSALATRIQQVQLLPKAAEAVAAISKVAHAVGEGRTPVAKSGKMANWAKRKIGGIAGAKIGMAVAGPMGAIGGYALGAEAIGNYTKAATQMAGASGRAMQRCADVAEKLLAGHRGAAVAAAVVNRAYAYSEMGPIKDPVERILEVQRIAGQPQAAREAIRKQIGDLAQLHPQMAQLIEDHAVNQVVSISVKAPQILFNRMGQPVTPPAGALRGFLEYENAVHNIDATLHKISKGVATSTEVMAMNEAAPQHMKVVAQGILNDTETLNKMPMSARRQIESMTGIPLTGRTDPQFMAKQMYNWEKSAAQNQPKGNPGALKPGAAGLSTPGQGGLGGRAPGN